MIKTLIYYFSGTGNSFYVAKLISEYLNAEMTPILFLNDDASVTADMIVFVFPIYDSKPPKVVTEKLGRLKHLKADKVVAIATYGVAMASSLKHFENTVNQLESKLTHGYGLKMPHNAVGNVGFTEIEIQNVLNRANEKLILIIDKILNQDNEKIESTSIFEGGTLLRQLPYVLKILSLLLFKGPKALAFKVTDACIHCQLCQKICPVDNITWDGSTENPIFGDRCTSCFACLQWCPKRAICFGNYDFESIGLVPYHHPKVTSDEMIRKYRR